MWVVRLADGNYISNFGGGFCNLYHRPYTTLYPGEAMAFVRQPDAEAWAQRYLTAWRWEIVPLDELVENPD